MNISVCFDALVTLSRHKVLSPLNHNDMCILIVQVMHTTHIID